MGCIIKLRHKMEELPHSYPLAEEVPVTMWLKIAIGAVVGLIIGSFTAPGYTLWVTVGVLAGYGVDAWMRRRGGGDGRDGPGDG